ncbi:hypothetical protein DFH07DRAFT_880861 [Mycena maculata]|uniref:Uncharacterized protein n=1 Tax=Mycena maculata TaxID=230809 RepID=A0AAD7JQD9_9AGAR|nr:hypothetical protein DFH07DRAFT_880861 [Mycena maculata]
MVEGERDAARRELGAAEQQRDVFREYYAKADAFAQEKGAENRALEQRVQIAEAQTREGVATVRAAFAAREAALQSDVSAWKAQVQFVREHVVRTKDPELRRRAAEHPEILARYEALRGQHEELQARFGALVDQNDILTERAELHEEDLRVKMEEIFGLEGRLEALRVQGDKVVVVDGDYQVLRCGWRAEATNTPCPALCRTQEDLDLHASMHVTRSLLDPGFNSQDSQDSQG